MSTEPWCVPSSHRLISEAIRCTAGRSAPGSSPRRRSRRVCPACPTACRSNPAGSRCAFRGAQDAVGRLFALAQALTHDYERFEALVEGGDLAGGGGAVRA